jgi:hypothetical protein
MISGRSAVDVWRSVCRGNARSLIIILAIWTLAGPVRATAAAKDAPRHEPKPLSQTLTGSAKADYEAAKELATDGDYAGALIKFHSAYDASKDPRVLWNVAFCHKNLRHYAKVTVVLKRYLSEGAALLSAGDKKEAQDLIAVIEPFTTRVTITVSQPGAQIFVDEEPVGDSPLGTPVVLDLGERRLRVTKDGYLPFEKSFVVAGGPELNVSAVLALEVHEGKLIVETPRDATVFLDGKLVGVGRVEKAIASGGHQLRVTAQAMRPYQSEVTIRDNETRSVNVLLEPEALAEKRLPPLRLSVGCGDPEPKGPEEGLTVRPDGLDALPVGTVKTRWSDEESRSIVEHADYPMSPGRHRLRVGINDCLTSDLDVNVDAVAGANVSGALEPSGSLLLRGPQGTPGFWRVGLGLWEGGGHVQKGLPEAYNSVHGPSMAGWVVNLGLVGRWASLYLDLSSGSGTLTRDTFNNPGLALPNSARVDWDRILLRGGPRFPLGRVSFGLGPLVGFQRAQLVDSTVNPNLHDEFEPIAGLYTELDVQPLCDWGAFWSTSLEFNLSDKGPSAGSDSDGGPAGSLQFGAFYAPNARCKRERAVVGLWQSDKPDTAVAAALGGRASALFKKSAGRAWRRDGLVMSVTGAVLLGLGVSAGLFAHHAAEQNSVQYDPATEHDGRLLEKVGAGVDVVGATAMISGAIMMVYGWRLGAEDSVASLESPVEDADGLKEAH